VILLLKRLYPFLALVSHPPVLDPRLIVIVGVNRLVDEFLFRFTHTTEIDYLLPGIAPTGKPVEIAMVGIIAFRGDKLVFE
jgi:hypothetical protein